MVASPLLIHKSTIEFVNTDFIPDNYVINKLSCYSLFDHNPYVQNCINVHAFPECAARLFDKLKRDLTFIFASFLFRTTSIVLV